MKIFKNLYTLRKRFGASSTSHDNLMMLRNLQKAQITVRIGIEYLQKHPSFLAKKLSKSKLNF